VEIKMKKKEKIILAKTDPFQMKHTLDWKLGLALALGILCFLNSQIIATMGVVIDYFCGQKCSELARDLGKKGNAAFFVGFLLGVIGLLFYYIYYLIQSKKQTEVLNIRHK
jgi:hypothetical protein